MTFGYTHAPMAAPFSITEVTHYRVVGHQQLQ